MRFIKLSFCCGLLFILYGCSWAEGLESDNEYKKHPVAVSLPLALPQELTANSEENYYPVPEVKNASSPSKGRVSLIPPGSNIKK